MKKQAQCSKCEFFISHKKHEYLVKWEMMKSGIWRVSIFKWQQSSFEQYDPSRFVILYNYGITTYQPTIPNSISVFKESIGILKVRRAKNH